MSFGLCFRLLHSSVHCFKAMHATLFIRGLLHRCVCSLQQVAHVMIPYAGGFADSSVRIYNLEKMAEARDASPDAAQSSVSVLWGHSGAVYGLDYTPDRQLLYTSSADGTVRLWSTEMAVNLVAYRWSHCCLLAATRQYKHSCSCSPLESPTRYHFLLLSHKFCCSVNVRLVSRHAVFFW